MEPRASILLTGGTGFFGKALLRHWLERQGRGNLTHNFVVLSRSPENFLAKYPEFAGQHWLRFHSGDILRPSTFPVHETFTHVLHAAADSTLGPQLTPLERYTQIVDGTRHLLDFAVAKNIPRFMLTSSGGVYGPQPQNMDRIPEAYNGMPDPLNPQNAYSVAKRCAEHLCMLYSNKHGTEIVIARCFAFVGRDLPLDVHFAIGNFIRDALWREEISVAGDGTAVRSYLDQRDLAEWLMALMEKGKAGRAYNVGSDQAVTIKELADQVRKLLAPSKSVRVLGGVGAGSQRSRYVPDVSRVRAELGLNVTIPLSAAITAAADIFKT
jgi:UDP-glucuronate decarboxylase